MKQSSQPKPKPKAKVQPKPKPKPKPRATPKKPPRAVKILPTLPLKKAEIKIAQVYWDSYGASAMVMFMVMLAITVFLVFAVLNKNSVQFVLFLSAMLCVFFLFELVRIAMDSAQKKKIEIICVFDKYGKSADNRLMKTNYMAQKVAGHTLLFPPEIYFSLDKGNHVRLFCTPIFKIVVGCEVFSGAVSAKR